MKLVYLIILAGVPSVLGFVPTTWLNWLVSGISFQLPSGTITHGDMTENAILQLVRDIFIDNPNSDNPGSTQRIENLDDIDASNLVKAYYGEKQRSITNNLEKTIGAIKDGNANVDLKGAEDKLAEAHFDSEQFQAGQNRLVMLRENVVSSIRMKNFDMARRDTGRLLHTLQDFYSHSNWVENGNSDIYRVLGRKNQRPDPVADVSLQTCTDCEEDGTVIIGRIIGFVRRADSPKNFYSCPDNFHGFLKQSRILTSGYYTGSLDSKGKIIAKPKLKCSHGGFLDSTSDMSAKGGINKDSLSEKWSPHYDQHTEAARLAEMASLDILQEIRMDVNDDALFSQFLGISVNVVSASIAYVIDTTEGMVEELPEIQATIPQLRTSLEQYAEMNGNTNIRYILVPFNDPDPGIIMQFNDIDEFLAAVGALTAGGGGDEPEPSIGAIIRAIEASVPGSPIYVFTDAPASDSHRLNEVETLVSEKMVQINFIYANNNGKKRSVQRKALAAKRYNSRTKRQDADATYEQLSAISGGQFLTVSTSDISELGSLVSFTAVQSHNTVFRREETLSGTRQFQFPVDTLTSEVMISVNAEQTINVSVATPVGINATDLPQYSVVPTDATNLYLASINVTNNTLRGNWTLTLATEGYYSVQVSAISDLSVSSDIYDPDATNDYGFSRIDGRPSQGIPIIVLFEVEPVNTPVTVNTLTLTNEDGMMLQSFSNITDLGANRFATGFLPPSVTFYFQVSGIDENGYNFLRTSDISVTVTTVNLLMSGNSGEFLTIRPEENQTVVLTLVNGAFNSDFQIIVNTTVVGNSTDFFEYNVEPSTILPSVPFNSSSDFSIDISVLANAADGDAATFTVRAESTNDSSINDFISFDLVVTTSPPPEFTENEVYDGPLPTDSGAKGTQIMLYTKLLMIALCLLFSLY